MRIEPFGVEQWMNAHETTCRYNLAETCVQSLTVAELLALTGSADTVLDDLGPMQLTYGAIEGSDRLRSAIAGLYDTVPVDRVMVTHGAIGANDLAYRALVESGDRVITTVPTYQQHYSIPESLGADCRRIELRPENDFLPDLAELQAAASEPTKLISMVNPNNPTGALMDEAFLRDVVSIAADCGAYLLIDEVYRGTDQAGSGTTASIVDLYELGIGIGSMSKAFSLAGLRLGWIVAPDEVLAAVSIHRDYNTISVSMIDDHLASIALEHADVLLERSRAITRRNSAMVERWIDSEPTLSWVPPRAGTTAFVRFDHQVSSRQFCIGLLEHSGVMFTPGSVLGLEGWLRIGYANDPEIIATGLDLTSDYLTTLPATVAG